MSAPASRSATGAWRGHMTVVVDVGCYHHPWHKGASQDSVAQLIERFHPDRLFGFDPHPLMTGTVAVVGDTVVTLIQAAAWTYNGMAAYRADGLEQPPRPRRANRSGASTSPGGCKAGR